MVKVTRAIPIATTKSVLTAVFMTISSLVPNLSDFEVLITVAGGEKGLAELANGPGPAAGSGTRIDCPEKGQDFAAKATWAGPRPPDGKLAPLSACR